VAIALNQNYVCLGNCLDRKKTTIENDETSHLSSGQPLNANKLSGVIGAREPCLNNGTECSAFLEVKIPYAMN